MATVEYQSGSPTKPRSDAPVFDSESWHATEIFEIPREQKSVLGKRDRGDSQIHRSNLQAELAEVRKPLRRAVTYGSTGMLPKNNNKLWSL
jgi:hypothetical protein